MKCKRTSSLWIWMVSIVTLLSGITVQASPYQPLKEPPINSEVPKPAIYMILDTSASMTASGLNVGFDWFEPQVQKRIEAAEAAGGAVNYKEILQSSINQYCYPVANRRNYVVERKAESFTIEDTNQYNEYEVVVAQNANGTYRPNLCRNLSRIEALQAIAPQMLMDYRSSALLGYGTLGYHSLHLAESSIYPSGEVILPVADLSKMDDKTFNQHLNIMGNFAANTVTPIMSAVYEATKQFRGAGIVTKRGRGVSNPRNIPKEIEYQVAESPIHYRCQENHIILFTDGAPNSGGVYNIVYNDHQKFGLESLYTSTIHQAEGLDHYVSPAKWNGIPELSLNLSHLLQKIDLRDVAKPIKYDAQNPEHQKGIYMKDPYGMLAYRSTGERVNRELDATGRTWHSFGSRPMPIYMHVLRLGYENNVALNLYLRNLLSPNRGVYVTANTAKDFLGGFDEIFKSIVTSTSGANATENQFNFTENSIRYSTGYDNVSWTGEIMAKKFRKVTDEERAEGMVDGWHREIWSTRDKVTGGQGIVLTRYKNRNAIFDLITARQYNPKAHMAHISWIRGYNRSGDQRVRNRPKAIGDIIDSNLAYFGTDRAYINMDALSDQRQWEFLEFIKLRANRAGLDYRDLLIAGANDGLIHFIYTKDNNPALRRLGNPDQIYNDYYSGRRYRAIFPAFLAERLDEITGFNAPHTFTMNGPTNIFDIESPRQDQRYRNFATIGVTAMGSGGKGLVGYQLFNAQYDGENRRFIRALSPLVTKWEIENESRNPTPGFENLGYTFSDMEMIQEGGFDADGRFEGRAIGIFGNGYHVDDQGMGRGSSLYLIDLESGEKLREIVLDKSGKGAATPALVVEAKENGHQSLTRLYVGTYDGLLYRLDFTFYNSAVNYQGTPLRLFDTGGRPITVRPVVEQYGSEGYWVMFGTGSIISERDRLDTSAQDYFISLHDLGQPKRIDDLKSIVLEHTLIEKQYEDDVDIQAYGSESAGLYTVTTKERSSSGAENGWALSLNSGRLKGERVIRPASTMAGRFVTFSTWGIELAPDPEDICIGDRSFGKTLFLGIKNGLGNYFALEGSRERTSGFGVIGSAPGETTGEGLVRHKYTGGGIGVGLFEGVRNHLYGEPEGGKELYDYTSYQGVEDEKGGKIILSTSRDDQGITLGELERERIYSPARLEAKRIYLKTLNH